MSRYFIFGITGLAMTLSAMSSTTVAVAFPVITSFFDTSLIVAGWVLSVYQLVLTAAMPLAGKTSDVFGRKNVFLACLVFFTLGSLLCAVAPSIQLLILSRVVQAIGAGGFMPSAAGIVADQFPKSRQQAIGLFTSIFPIGQIIGPNLGAWLTTVYGWRSIFWFNIPLTIIALISAVILLPRDSRRKSTIDLAGAGLFTGSVSSLMVGLSIIGNGEVSWALVGILFAVSIILMIAFLKQEAKVKDPIIEPEVLRHKPFMAANAYNFIFGASYFGIASLVPLYAVSVYDMSLLTSGLILTPRSIGMILTSTITSIFLLRWGYRWPIVIGTAGVIISLILLGIELPGFNVAGIWGSATVLLIAITLLTGLAMGIAAPASNNACIELMPHRVATITGIRGMFRQTGGAISISVATLTIQSVGDMARGFQVVFFGLAAIMLLFTPVIFLMPRNAARINVPGEEPDRQVVTARAEKDFE